ncbi:MAG: excinuclease ABC subunit UvrA, partial [Gemmatimonadetes bacterium]|nr:excinuclease ABC subunit UvrA [Gemmatimonadota bacterium]
DSIEGLSPAVAIEQRNPTKTSRSTVGTATEVYDFLRLLFARVGRTHCPRCDREIVPDSVTGVVDRLLDLDAGTRMQVAFPLVRSGQVSHDLLVENLLALGFVRCWVDGEIHDLTSDASRHGPSGAREGSNDGLDGPSGGSDGSSPGFDLAAADQVMVIVDRLKVQDGIRDRLADSVGTCFREGEGEVVVLTGEDEPLRFTEHYRCPDHPEVEFLDPTPRLFSFNSPYGSCPDCTGFGATLEYDPGLIVPRDDRSLDDGAVDPWSKPRYGKERSALRRFADAHGVSVYAPWRDLPPDFKDAVLYGRGDFKGVMGFLRSKEPKRYKQYIRVFLRQYQSPTPCKSCDGSRLRPEALYVRVGGWTIGDTGSVPIEELELWLKGLDLREMETRIASTILRELSARIGFLRDVGLGYLSLGRQTRTLSGGEAQRISLANSLGANLVDTLYVLDEPSIGLHPRDTEGLLELLRRLRDVGNTVIVVEHDESAILAADHVVELGPASGEEGGDVVYEGPPASLPLLDTATGRYLSGRSGCQIPESRRPVDHGSIHLAGARLHNVKDVDVEIPLGAMTVVTGVSGSGKSTMVHDILFRALEREIKGGDTSAKEHLGEAVGTYGSLRGHESLEDVVLIDQSPIGRTPRSNPITYIRAWGEIRRIFAEQPAAKAAGLDARAFSFNVEGGRCPACKGAGYVEVEMIFMADIYVPCDHCGAKRYRPEVLEVRVQDLSIAQVLELTVDEAIRFFLREPRLGQSLWYLQQVGLGYLRLGQPATTLSGGEAQRLKIARELATSASGTGPRLYILDEPTTGLSGEDVSQLSDVLQRLVSAGHTVVVIEHNLDLVKTADWMIDMGPGAGSRGGEVVAMGRPEDVASVPESVTGTFLRPVLSEAAVAG